MQSETLLRRRVPRTRPAPGAAGRAFRTASWVAGLALLVACLHAAGDGLLPAPPWSPAVGPWLAEHGGVVAVFALVRLLALGLAWYLLIATVVLVVARWVARHGTAPARCRRPLIAPGLRPVLERVVGVSLCSVLAVPTVASANPPAPPDAVVAPATPGDGDRPASPLLVGDEPPPLVLAGSAAGRSDDVTGPQVRHRAAGPPTAPAKLALASDGWGSDVHVVVAGDSFWRIAVDVVARSGRRPTDGEVARYWRRLVTANRERLHDPANPDLLFPGQLLHVVPVAGLP